MVIACLNRAFFRAFILMSKHVSFQVLEYFAAIRVYATADFPMIIATEVGLATLRLTGG